MNNIKIIAVGNKARQGKDIFAGYLRNKLDNSFILHWADPLKDEVSEKSELPLIFKKHANGKDYYHLRDGKRTYQVYTAEEMPLLHKVFTERNISEYYNMKEKDSLILQVWGTDFRRNLDPDHWVKKIDKMISNLKDSLNGEQGYIIIPDTRFLNELEYCKNNDGLYVRAMRLLETNMQYVDPDRDPFHPSETGLDTAKADYTMLASSGDLKAIERQAETFIKKFL